MLQLFPVNLVFVVAGIVNLSLESSSKVRHMVQRSRKEASINGHMLAGLNLPLATLVLRRGQELWSSHGTI